MNGATYNGPSLPALWPSCDEQFTSSDEIWCDALGLAIAGAVAGHSLCLDAADGQQLHTGLHVLISTNNESPVLSTLAQLVQPLKSEYMRLESLAEIERQICQRRIDELKAQYASYLQTDTLPGSQQAKFFADSLKSLEGGRASTRLMECPLPGRLVLAVENSSDILATYDDLAFSALLDAAGRPRGILDMELLAKSWRQQVFDGAQWEGVCSKVICDPKVWAIVVARPETTARFLLASEPVVAGFADCCWVVDATQSLNLQAGIVKAATWHQTISRLVDSNPAGERIRLSKGAGKLLNAFQREVASACPQTSAEQRLLVQLPRLVAKLGLGLHLTESLSRLTSVTEAQFSKALSHVNLAIRQRQRILRKAREESDERQLQQRCEIVLQKISALGPISARDLAHTFDDQRLHRLLPVLKHLITNEQILKRSDGRFDIPQRWLRKLTMEIC